MRRLGGAGAVVPLITDGQVEVQEKLELCTLQVAKNKLMKHVEDLTLRLQLEKLLILVVRDPEMRRDGLRVAFEASKFCNEGICEVFEDSIQIAQDDITFSLNPGEVDEPQEENKVLLGKIISRYKLGKAAIQGSLKLSWNAIRGWKWKEIENGLLQFTFANRNDALNVLAWRPWFVCGALLIVSLLSIGTYPTSKKWPQKPPMSLIYLTA
ncbi:hypothetical protein G4B88_020323 [Cannabis sativa]|uniref:DUF4283 domain-containing protein n=1 Tax=Cannabis sativa TaxID=3483 RepID=A0A7J6EAS1_CANSA|nr:hypothetical protein G4B88_020323 [Cannabis sativa]